MEARQNFTLPFVAFPFATLGSRVAYPADGALDILFLLPFIFSVVENGCLDASPSFVFSTNADMQLQQVGCLSAVSCHLAVFFLYVVDVDQSTAGRAVMATDKKDGAKSFRQRSAGAVNTSRRNALGVCCWTAHVC